VSPGTPGGARWRTPALSLLAGAAAALAFPPFSLLPGLLGYALLMGLWDRPAPERRLKSAFWRGWLAGTAFFLISTWWVAEAFFVDAKDQGWMAPIAVALLASGLGLFWGGAGLLYAWLRSSGALRPVVFAGCFCLFEWLRGHVLTGFPWDLAGETWRAGSAPSQAASVVGAYGLGWITVAACAAPALLWRSRMVDAVLPTLLPLREKEGPASKASGRMRGLTDRAQSFPAGPAGSAIGEAEPPARPLILPSSSRPGPSFSRKGRRDRRADWTAVGLAALSIAGLYAYGVFRLPFVVAVAGPHPQPRQIWVRVVQADVDQESKYDEALFRSILDRYTRLTAQLPASASGHAPDIVIWPEGAIPDAVNDYLAPDTWTRKAIAGALRPGQTLLVGGYRLAGSAEQPKAYNSLLALRAEGGDLAMTALYDKFRLVPFGEYLPAEPLLAPLGFKKLVHVTDGFDPGPPPRPISPEGAPPVQPLICYESLFPGFVRQGARIGGRPAWIVNISNDAWFGKTSGPWQHLNIASYRAIEEGLPMVRATPTGVSAVIDAYGRIRPGASLGQGVLGVIDAPLPPALAPTPFDRWGETFFWSMMALSALVARYARMNRRVTTTV